METVYLFIIFVGLVAGYAYFSLTTPKTQMQFATEAGPIENSDAEKLRLLDKKVGVCMFKYNGNEIMSSDYIRILVQGNCMSPRGINSGESWLVEPIHSDKGIDTQVKKGDVLLVYLEDKNMYKIREFKDFADKEHTSLQTFWYNGDKGHKDSTRPHSLSSVKGVVRYKVANA